MFTCSSRARVIALVVVVGLAASACGQTTDIEKAQAKVKAATTSLEQAEAAYDESRVAFCDDATTYVVALDRYSKVFTDATATVGDVRTLGADLERPGTNVASSAQAAVDANQAVVEARNELAEAQADLASLESGSSTTDAPPSSTTPTTLLPPADVDLIRTEETDMDTALGAVTDQTPLVQAGQQVNAAAFALQAAWGRVLADAGCLTDDQASNAEQAIAEYTAAVQSALKVTGHYSGPVDGVYGPSTLAAVEEFQTEQQLPVTGYVDIATSRALGLTLQQQGGTAAAQAIAHAAAVQTALKLAGYWNGAIDGQWTDELTAALKSFQTALGVAATGAVDTATLAALQQAIEAATSPDTTTTTGPAPDPTTSSTSSTTEP